METKPNFVYDNVIQVEDTDNSRRFMAGVFLWMFVALTISAAFAFAFATVPQLSELLIRNIDGERPQMTGLGILAMLSPLLFVLITIRFGFNRIAYPVLSLIFLAYASVTGISLSILFAIYTLPSIITVFGVAALIFGIMAVAGYITDTDLTKFGSLLVMLLIGVIVASVINVFLHSESLYYIISYAGVAVFVGLTAYDVQRLKNIGAGLEYGDASSKKLALMGALSLYLDFVNLFIFLLRIFGRRK